MDKNYILKLIAQDAHQLEELCTQLDLQNNTNSKVGIAYAIHKSESIKQSLKIVREYSFEENQSQIKIDFEKEEATNNFLGLVEEAPKPIEDLTFDEIPEEEPINIQDTADVKEYIDETPKQDEYVNQIKEDAENEQVDLSSEVNQIHDEINDTIDEEVNEYIEEVPTTDTQISSIAAEAISNLSEPENHLSEDELQNDIEEHTINEAEEEITDHHIEEPNNNEIEKIKDSLEQTEETIDEIESTVKEEEGKIAEAEQEINDEVKETLQELRQSIEDKDEEVEETVDNKIEEIQEGIQEIGNEDYTVENEVVENTEKTIEETKEKIAPEVKASATEAPQEPVQNIQNNGLYHSEATASKEEVHEEKETLVYDESKSLLKQIGLNDKFLFIRELFDGDSQKYNTTIEYIDNCSTSRDAANYLKQNFVWRKNDVSQKFVELIRRRFSN